MSLDLQPDGALSRRGGRGGAGARRPASRSAAWRASSCARSSTGWRTRPQLSTSCVSPPASTRSFRARARSSARSGRRSRPARPDRCWTGSSARRCTQARRCAPRRRSPRVRRRSRRPRRHWPSRCSAGSTGAGCCSSAPVTSRSSPPAASPRGAPRSRTSRIARRNVPPSSRPASAARESDSTAPRPCSGRSTWSSRRPARPAGCSCATSVEAALHGRKGRPLFLIDLAVPRDLDPAIHELDACYLYDIDDLESVVASSLAGTPS